MDRTENYTTGVGQQTTNWETLRQGETYTTTFGKMEDIQRELVKMRKITLEDFNSSGTIGEESINSAAAFVQENIQSGKYDSFPLAKWIHENMTSPEQLHELDDETIYGRTNGGTCIQMAKSLQRFYSEHGIKSHFVPFETAGQINEAGHEYNPYGHLACIAPFIDGDKQKFLLVDQGLALTEPIVFPARDNSEEFTYGNKEYRVSYDDSKKQNPYTLEISELKDGEYRKIDEAHFDPFAAMENPRAFTPDALRVLPGFRTTKYDQNGKAVASASVDYRKNGIKLKHMESGVPITTRIKLDEDFGQYLDEIYATAEQLEISGEELMDKLRIGVDAKDKMLGMVLAPSVIDELVGSEKMRSIPEKLEYKAIVELSEGKLYYHEHIYDLKINATQEEKASEPTPFGESIPTIQIDDKEAFEASTRKLLEFSSNNSHLFWIKSRADQAPEKTREDILAQIWFNATEEDFRSPAIFIERQIAFMEDDTFSNLLEQRQIIGGDFKGSRLLVDVIQQSGSNETPYMMNFTLEDPDGAKCQIPSVRYAIEQGENGEKTGYIFAIQTPKNTESTKEGSRLSKKMNRYFYKINDGVLRSESLEYQEYRERRSNGEDMGGIPYPKNISDVTVSSVLSLSAALKMMADKGIVHIRVPYFCPLRFQAHARLGQEEQYRIQDNTSNKFIRTFKRVAYHFPSVIIGEVSTDGYTDIRINGALETENEVLKNVQK